MKVKTKLFISFCIIIFVPIFLASLVLWGFQNVQMREIKQTYGLEGMDIFIWPNSIQMLNRYTIMDFRDICAAASEPEKFEDGAYLNQVNEGLKGKYSYLIVRRGQDIIFNGGDAEESALAGLPLFGMPDSDANSGTYIDWEDETLVKWVDFYYTDGTEGSVFLITKTDHMLPEIKELLIDIVISVLLILTLTACMLTIWIYRSIVTPIKKLQTAAENIREGNLDFQVEVASEDEIGELCFAFEQMRQRLKDNAEEKMNNESENRALISNIAHDLKTPITAVKGYSEGILDGVANTPEKVDKYVRTIYNKATEMDTLINELTLYSKIDTNRIPYNFSKLNVTDYFNDCIEEIGLDLEAKGIGLSYYNYVSADILIIADPEQLRRVISNIIGNSVKYMNAQRGFISIRIKDVGDFIQVEMEDNGIGIAQQNLPYIFDRFYRTDASRNSATGGSGIGLSIVKKIIEDHGGKIWATSKEGNGTTMYFVIRKYQEVINE